jgi:integrase
VALLFHHPVGCFVRGWNIGGTKATNGCEKKDQRMPVIKLRFTKAELLAVVVPEGKPFIDVQDIQVPTLRCRITKGGRFMMHFNKKVGGRHVRRKLGDYLPGPGGKTLDDFRLMARAQHGKIDDDAQTWLEGDATRDAGDVTLAKAFELALKASRRGTLAVRDWNEARDKFTTWMKDNAPYVTTWERLRRQHVRDYLDSLQPGQLSLDRGMETLSPTRRRLLMQPIAQTARFMWHEYELPNVAERLGLSAKLAKTPAPVYLADVLKFLDHLKARGLAALEAGAALAGLAGLQLLEVIRLRWSRVDLERGLIEISGEVKNTYRNRVIPVPVRCLDALKRAHNNRPVERIQDMDGGPVVVSPAGRPFEGNSWMNYSKLMRTEFLAWNAEIKWAPKDLRNCVMTLAALRGFGGDVLEQYVGHAPRTVTARNYIPRLSPASIGEAAELENQMKNFRRLVTDLIDDEVKAAGKAKKIETVDGKRPKSANG